MHMGHAVGTERVAPFSQGQAFSKDQSSPLRTRRRHPSIEPTNRAKACTWARLLARARPGPHRGAPVQPTTCPSWASKHRCQPSRAKACTGVRPLAKARAGPGPALFEVHQSSPLRVRRRHPSRAKACTWAMPWAPRVPHPLARDRPKARQGHTSPLLYLWDIWPLATRNTKPSLPGVIFLAYGPNLLKNF